MSAHDQRSGDERWYWIAPVSDEAVPRTLQVAKEGEPLSAGATSLPAMQRPGDLIVYCGARTGVIFGVAEVAGEPIRKEDEHGTWRVRVTPRLILDREHAPSLGPLGIDPPRRPLQLEPEEYKRIYEQMAASAAVVGGHTNP
jgi:hypothetical protein